MFKVEITARNFTYGSNVFGKGGTYEVSERTARYIVKSGKGNLVQGKLSAEEPETSGLSNTDIFLAMVKNNAAEVLQILEAEAKQARDRELNGEADESEETSTSTSGDSLSETGQNDKINDEDASPKINQIPEDFPGRELLTKAGYTSLDEIPKDKESLMAIEGMSTRVVNQIGVKLSQGE